MARTVEDCALAWSVLSGEPVPEPSLEGKRIGKLTRLPSLGEPEPAPHDPRTDALPGRAGRAAGARGRRVAGLLRRRRRVAPRDSTRSARRDYGPAIRAKLARAVRTTPEAARARAARRWRPGSARRRRTRRSTSSSRPCSACRSCPTIETPEEEFRIPFSAYARPFNFLGWPAIAIGETQLAARDMRTLLEAALAWRSVDD